MSDTNALEFMQDRLTALRTAASYLRENDQEFAVDDVLEVASWIAGDHLSVGDSRGGDDGVPSDNLIQWFERLTGTTEEGDDDGVQDE